jgi:tetratricopeptide (TPR) repeat protein
MEQARAINADAGSLLNEVNCVIGLAEIPIRRFEHQTAIISLQEALALCRRIGSVLNQANCTMKLGQIELHRSNGETAAFYFEDALVLYRRIGDLLGEGNCAGGLGRIARLTSNHTRACALFEGALTLFRTGGYEMQESLARIELGRAQRDAGDVMLCLGNIEAGFAQYFGKADLADRALSGWHCVRSGLTCEDPDEAANSREKARSAWAAIGRFDLIHNWIGER